MLKTLVQSKCSRNQEIIKIIEEIVGELFQGNIQLPEQSDEYSFAMEKMERDVFQLEVNKFPKPERQIKIKVSSSKKSLLRLLTNTNTKTQNYFTIVAYTDFPHTAGLRIQKIIGIFEIEKPPKQPLIEYLFKKEAYLHLHVDKTSTFNWSIGDVIATITYGTNRLTFYLWPDDYEEKTKILDEALAVFLENNSIPIASENETLKIKISLETS